MQRRELIKLSAVLLGGATSATLSQALLAGVQSAPAAFTKVFDDSQQQTVRILCDLIIPETDTPGAVEAGVHEFVGTIVDEWYTETEKTIFMEGLAALDQFCIEKVNLSFHLADEPTRVSALQEQEAMAKKYKGPQGGAAFGPPVIDENEPFFSKLRELVVLGYYTSEIGSTHELAYRPVPGVYNGEYEFSKVGKQFSH